MIALLRRTLIWWLVPLLVIFGLTIFLVLGELDRWTGGAYSVF